MGREVYFRNQGKPRCLIVGCISAVYPSRGLMAFCQYGRMYAVSTAAAVCTPPVSEKISTNPPVRKAKSNNKLADTSKGKVSINNK